MKISKKTLDVFSNFATVYNSLLVRKGKHQRTNSVGMTILADANLDEDFPMEFGIFDLSQFLNVLSSFKEPDLTFGEKGMTISSGEWTAVYRYCEPALISRKLIPLEKNLELKSVDIEFLLDKEKFAQAKSTTNVLGISHLAVVGDGVNLSLCSLNPKDENANQVKLDLGKTDARLKIIFNLDTLNILPHTYKVQISKNKLAKFISQEMDLVYTVPCDKESSFD